MSKKPKTDPRLKLVDFVKPDGTPVPVNSFPDSLNKAISLGWLPAEEVKAAKAAKPKPKSK